MFKIPEPIANKPKPVIVRTPLSSARIIWTSLIGGLIIYAGLWTWAMQNAPRQNYIFERLPPLEGIYQYEPSLTRGRGDSSKSSILGKSRIYCGTISFFDSATHSCGREFLNQKTVTIVHALNPTFLGLKPVIVKFSALDTNYILLNDAEIRSEWLSNTRFDCTLFSALGGGFIFLLMLYLAAKRLERIESTPC
jgi:hypothetical protein